MNEKNDGDRLFLATQELDSWKNLPPSPDLNPSNLNEVNDICYGMDLIVGEFYLTNESESILKELKYNLSELKRLTQLWPQKHKQFYEWVKKYITSYERMIKIFE